MNERAHCYSGYNVTVDAGNILRDSRPLTMVTPRTAPMRLPAPCIAANMYTLPNVVRRKLGFMKKELIMNPAILVEMMEI